MRRSITTRREDLSIGLFWLFFWLGSVFLALFKGLFEFADSLAKTAAYGRQALGAKKEQTNKKDDQKFRQTYSEHNTLTDLEEQNSGFWEWCQFAPTARAPNNNPSNAADFLCRVNP